MHNNDNNNNNTIYLPVKQKFQGIQPCTLALERSSLLKHVTSTYCPGKVGVFDHLTLAPAFALIQMFADSLLIFCGVCSWDAAKWVSCHSLQPRTWRPAQWIPSKGSLSVCLPFLNRLLQIHVIRCLNYTALDIVCLTLLKAIKADVLCATALISGNE